ncbi:DUF2505 domain-containing protein [Rhodococcus sp. HNM0569]|uniref:DUF2505 family protein n=1 Tax=Rhodococcus sp. HNM0569 TaxID=2716340 RepID=UPI00146DF7A6|nr:DUF2505 domain-containing protein [Rhodococcus sp. HNM0569]
MSRRIEHSSEYPFSVADVHSALTSEQYWRDRLAEVGGHDARLVRFEESADGGVTVEMTQAIPEAQLPPMVTAVKPGDMIIRRTEEWSAVQGGAASGTFSAEVDGAPAGAHGTQTLAAAGSGSTVTLDAHAEVRIPLIGGRIEAAVADRILELVEGETTFTIEWIGRNAG